MNWSIMKNPYVIAAGVGLGIILLLRNSGGSSSSESDNTAYALSVYERNNAAAMQLSRDVAELDVRRQMALSTDTTTLAIAGLQTISALQGARLALQSQWDESRTGLAISNATNRANIQVERINAANRLAMGQLEKSTILESLAIEAGRNPNVDQPDGVTKHGATKGKKSSTAKADLVAEKRAIALNSWRERA